MDRCPVCGKICYTEKQANAVINDAKRGITIVRGGKTIRIRNRKQIPRRKYFCKACGFWHVTHESKRNYKENYDYV